MNVQLKDITVTARDGRVSHLDQVYIRGSHVRFFIVPDMLRYAPTKSGPGATPYERNLWTDVATGMRLCSGNEAQEVAELDLREAVRQSIGRGRGEVAEGR